MAWHRNKWWIATERDKEMETTVILRVFVVRACLGLPVSLVDENTLCVCLTILRTCHPDARDPNLSV